MKRLLYGDRVFKQHQYVSEREFEQRVIQHAGAIFGEKSVYIDIKKQIRNAGIATIPDGYLLNFTFQSDPRLYIIENELATHDPYRHIGQQLLKFAISYKASGHSIKSFLTEHVLGDKLRQDAVEEGCRAAGFRNIDAMLEVLIFEKQVGAIVIIDEISSDLENVLAQLTMSTDILEFSTYECGPDVIHCFTPFQDELVQIIEESKPKVSVEEADTIVVPAREDGFKEVFMGENCWYKIRMSSAMKDRIRYIAAYQTAPVSAITHYAEIRKIEKYRGTGKYILYFKDQAKKIGPIKLSKARKGLAPQAPRYTSFSRLLKAKSLVDLF